ncbi:AAA family ATPase [Candidatus Parabeggiatoa sp. HSG14]|uniref:AAA family ATPase n=1 Tax=Candidatus Parabeggiatoa sp. HSG14 TaxID=3055593 RepID=UPI0025A786CC|nr:AAA family ATPase [Thiotrichales bacterium HSG14]
MKLQLENIGIIKNATLQFNGLTVIAGENDTGKTTVGKALFSEIRQYKKVSSRFIFEEKLKPRKHFQPKSGIKFSPENHEVNFPIFIDTPDFLSKFNYLKNTLVLLQQDGLNFTTSIEVTDLILRISQPKVLTRSNKYFNNIKKIIHGEVFYDSSNDDIFYKKEGLSNKLEMTKTSSGIKMFGFFQILILNKSLTQGSVLILDEPEVHLHPKWQLKYAQLIVSLVKEDIIILVNSHSPYMIEALKKYGTLAKINMNFYLANLIGKQATIEEVTKNISPIFEQLSEPFETFDEMDSQVLQGG